MKNLEIKSKTDWKEIIQGREYLLTERKEIEKMILNNLVIIPVGNHTHVIGITDKKIISDGIYFATSEEVKQMALNYK